MRRTLNVRFLIGSLAVLFLAGTLVHFTHAWQVRRNAGSLVERADQANQTGDLEQAIRYYRHYLVQEPEDFSTRAKLALILDLRAAGPSDWDQVVGMFRQVLDSDPGRNDLRMRLVHDLIRLQRFSEAIAHIETLLPEA